MTTSQTVSVDADRLTEWIGSDLPGRGLVRLERIGQAFGVANALYLVERDDPAAADGTARWVLRRPPAVVNAPGASDIGREWRLLTALEGTSVPHPTPLLHCADPEVIGAPFLLMSVVDGFTPVDVLPAPYNRPENRRALGLAMVDAIADLGNVDWRARGLEGLGRPEGFLERQVGRWLRQLDGYHTRDIPLLDTIADWLERNRPAAGEAGILHGDYSPFNVMASWTDPTRLAAVVDWDTGTVGDPLLDIGHLLARWAEPGEEAPIVRVDIARREGLPTRAELADRYVERSGRDLSAIRYYEVLSLFKLAIILEGGVARLRAAGDPAGDERAAGVDRLFRHADAFARGERT
ncbi:phosphotransferase family protein [Pseudonocardia sp. NPDC049154]|uniref:phosphotransferase family protein n=1 Tax=Pseudonocardia sp. NPDC049154 TaxID=3155501 RepID=UPI0033F9E1CC